MHVAKQASELRCVTLQTPVKDLFSVSHDLPCSEEL